MECFYLIGPHAWVLKKLNYNRGIVELHAYLKEPSDHYRLGPVGLMTDLERPTAQRVTGTPARKAGVGTGRFLAYNLKLFYHTTYFNNCGKGKQSTCPVIVSESSRGRPVRLDPCVTVSPKLCGRQIFTLIAIWGLAACYHGTGNVWHVTGSFGIEFFLMNIEMIRLLLHQRCAMICCCGCVWLPPIIFIGTYSLALVESDSASFFTWKDTCYGCMLWVCAKDSFHTTHTSHTRAAHQPRSAT
ncbi:hypothetical protein SFRURICE_016857 [Spodoptera frugiperda]|nr:hypothetical protein SFRURICE_016857 [Spodoptera frugiperda]